ncbi:MAG: hypothetical protein JSW20_04950 [Nitrospiraceae bacterium]|nr:MAG: hypothetical protein JSW20_04950 [Nitrospiraceae bacterium]
MRYLIICVFTLSFFLYPVLIVYSVDYGSLDDQYWPSSTCRDCHVKIIEQHLKSMHSRSFTNDVFQAQYFKEVVPSIEKENGIAQDAEGCIACHSPVAYNTGKKLVMSEDQIQHNSSGVTCDFCHTIKDYKGETPGGGNYISTPSKQKLGPFKSESNWHHTYSELHTKSEFCAICHNMINRHGVEIKSTYSEWKNSPYAEQKIQCQDCHMNARGYLIEDEPVYESGKASYSLLGHSPHRERLYTHRFPGAHIKEQIAGSITLDMEFSSSEASAGDEIVIKVTIDNSRTGHKMPTGSADLRFMYLELKSSAGNRSYVIPAIPEKGLSGYDVTGSGPSDAEILGNKIADGMRIYRSIYVDKESRHTLASYEAVRIIFDNRIRACEMREETYDFEITDNAGDSITIEAGLYYMPYPAAFAEKLDLPEPEAFEISSIKKKLIIR